MSQTSIIKTHFFFFAFNYLKQTFRKKTESETPVCFKVGNI